MIGQTLGAYHVTGKLGEGGMGEVYRARDGKLQRDVALKILPEAFAVDPDRVARFTREAQALAALSHPNIAAIHGFEEANGVRALVLELVEGPTLADRIAEGPLPLDEALPIARQIGEALSAAHEQGIVHRDLKPANIKLRPDGAVKVLDFGLAKLVELDTARTGRLKDLSLSPTITSPAVTGMGLILGTAAYMSPEQARGRTVDKRTDVWAFGCGLFEMLSGARAFEGDDATETIAAVVKSTPDWGRLPADTPEAIRRLIQRCLEKDVRQRVSDMSIPLYLLSDPAVLSTAGPSPGRSAAGSRNRRWLVPLVSAAAAALATALVTWAITSPGPPEVGRFDIVPAPGQELRLGLVPPGHKVAISRTGSHVFWVGGAGAPGIHARRRDDGAATRLADGGNPFVSPTGEWVGFFQAATRTLRRVSFEGGSSVEIAPYEQNIGGATWGDDDWIVFATADPGTGLRRVRASGGDPEILTTPDRERGESDHLWPRFLPGARALLFTIEPVPGPRNRPRVAVLDLTQTPLQYRTILENASDARYLSSGHVVYVADGRLYATAFDLDALTPTGASVPLDIDVTVSSLIADFDVSESGHLVHATGTNAVSARSLVWLDPRNDGEESVGAETGTYVYLRLSPDESTVALDRRDASDVFTYHLRTRAYERVTAPDTLDRAPVWWGDTRLVFSSNRQGDTSLFWQASDGTGSPTLLVTGKSGLMFASAVAPDNALLINRLRELPATADLIRLALPQDAPAPPPASSRDESGGTAAIAPLLETSAGEINPEVSPDGRFLAFQSNVSGVWKVYVAPYPDPASGRREPVSPGSGIQPLWSRDGRHLYYLTLEGDMMAVPVAAGARSWPDAAGAPARLFDARGYYRGDEVLVFRTYDVARDGRFLMIRPEALANAAGTPSMLKVVRHWLADTADRLP